MTTRRVPPPALDARQGLGSGRVPGLDGLRALSIALVYWCHFAPTIAGRLPKALLILARESEIGVDVFFVVSGLIITLLLLREEDATGRISLRGFFARRALRLLPAYLAYLGFVAILATAGLVMAFPNDWVAALTYFADGISLLGRDPAWPFAHLWSLSVEEHFYLAWPVALVVLGRDRARAALMVAIALVPTIRLVETLSLPIPVHYGLMKFSTPTRIDSIGFGCILGFLLREGEAPRAPRPSDRAGMVRRLALWGLVGSAVVYSAFGLLEVVVKPTLKAAAVAWLVHLGVRQGPGSVVGRVLNARPVVRLGALSYSLYLWQQPFFDSLSGLAICRWPANAVLAVGCAVLSHALIERPFLRLKDRLGPGRAGPRAPHLLAGMTAGTARAEGSGRA